MQKFINNWGTVLTTQTLVAGLTFTVSTAQATLLNARGLDADNPVKLTLYAAGVDISTAAESDTEVVLITAAHTGTGVLTVPTGGRAQEGTTAVQWEIGANIQAFVTEEALENFEKAAFYTRGGISGVGYNRASATTVEIETGWLDINGAFIAISSPFTTKTAASSSLVAAKLYHIYITDDSGTIKQEWDVWATTGDDPVYDADLDYWKHPSKGAGFRWVGSFFSASGVAEVDQLVTSTVGRDINVTHWNKAIALTVTSDGSYSLSGIVPKPASTWRSNIRLRSTSGVGMRYVYFHDTDATEPYLLNYLLYCSTTNVGGHMPINKYSDTIYVDIGPSAEASLYSAAFVARR